MSEEQQKRIDELESIVRRLLDIDFIVPSELDGDRSCFFCGAYLEGGEQHAEDCAYIEAKQILGTFEKPTYHIIKNCETGESIEWVGDVPPVFVLNYVTVNKEGNGFVLVHNSIDGIPRIIQDFLEE